MKKPALFRGGPNIALKVPPHLWDETVAFYRDTLALQPISAHLPAVVFRFGASRLWIDRVEHLSQPETWLELQTPDTALAARHLEAAGVTRCDDIEALPEGFDGFWVSAPGGIIHLVVAAAEDSEGSTAS